MFVSWHWNAGQNKCKIAYKSFENVESLNIMVTQKVLPGNFLLRKNVGQSFILRNDSNKSNSGFCLIGTHWDKNALSQLSRRPNCTKLHIKSCCYCITCAVVDFGTPIISASWR
jgi:hypothetical protein